MDSCFWLKNRAENKHMFDERIGKLDNIKPL